MKSKEQIQAEIEELEQKRDNIFVEQYGCINYYLEMQEYYDNQIWKLKNIPQYENQSTN